MPYREVTMIEIKEILRLWLAGLPKEGISAQLGVDRKTVRRYVGAAQRRGLVAAEGERALTDAFLVDLMLELRPDDPVLHERQDQNAPVAEDLAELLVANLGQRREHHQDEPHRDGDRRRPDAQPIERGGEPGRGEPHPHPERHRGKDPKRQVAVEKGKLAGDAGSLEGRRAHRHHGPPTSAFIRRSVRGSMQYPTRGPSTSPRMRPASCRT